MQAENITRVAKQVLNRFGFNDGLASQPYFMSTFLDYLLQVEVPKGCKTLNFFTKFSGDKDESTVKHIARYTIEIRELVSNKLLKMRLFPSSPAQNVFTWFSNLKINSIHAWAQLEIDFFSMRRHP